MVEGKDIIEFCKRAYGIDNLYEHQLDALLLIADGLNTLVTVPTASGKTLIAIGAIYKALMEGKKAIYVSPLVALSSEKHAEFNEIFNKRAKELGLPKEYNVVLSTGESYKFTKNENARLAVADLIITTNEKLDSIIRRKPKWIKDIGVVVFDEVHLLYDQNRGSTLEMVQTYFKYLIDKGEMDPIVIALSATIGNPEDLGDWLNAEIVESTFRPVKLEKLVYDADEQKLILFDGIIEADSIDMEEYFNLPKDFILDRFKKNKQVIAFVSTRRSAEATAKNMTKYTKNYLTEEDKKRIKEMIQFIGDTPVEKKIKEYITQGAAFHHAGLSYETRDVVERLFREGHIKFIAATPSISVGVNLPANTVIIRDIKRWTGRGQNYLRPYEIEQMLGRAGRPQYDKKGYGIIVAKNLSDLNFIKEKYLNPQISPVYSPLLMNLLEAPEKRDEIETVMSTKLGGAFLGIINILNKPTKEDIIKFFDNTYMKYTIDYEILPYYVKRYTTFELVSNGIAQLVENALEYLELSDMITIDDEGKIHLTKYGKKVMELYISPFTAEYIREHLHELKNEISVLSLVVKTPEFPYRITSRNFRKKKSPLPGSWDADDYENFFRAYSSYFILDDPTQGITFDEIRLVAILYDWILGVDIENLVVKYNIMPGEIYRLVSGVRWLVYATSRIYNVLMNEKNEMLEKLTKRLEYGVTEEALELVNVRGVGRVRAKKLMDAGVYTVEELAEMSVEELKKILGVKNDKLAKKIINEARLLAGLEPLD